MPLPAGTGLDRRHFLSRTLGAALAVYGGSRARAPGVRRGDRRARVRACRTVLVSSSSRAVSTASPCSPRRATRSTTSCDRSSRSPEARLLPRTTASTGTRRSSGLQQLYAEKKVTVLRRSATPTPTSRTSRHATTGRSGRPRSTSGPAGSAGTSTGSARKTTRCRDCRSTSPCARARDRQGAGSDDSGRRPVHLRSAGCRARSSSRCSRRQSGAGPRTRRIPDSRPPAVALPRTTCAGAGRVRLRLLQPGQVPDVGDPSRTGSRGSQR